MALSKSLIGTEKTLLVWRIEYTDTAYHPKGMNDFGWVDARSGEAIFVAYS